MAAIGDALAIPLTVIPSATQRRRVSFSGKVVFGSSGAIDTTNSVTPAVTPTKTGTGTYRLTFNPGLNVRAQFTYFNNNGSGIIMATGLAISEANGTVDFIVVTQGATDAAANPGGTSGDYVCYTIEADA